MGLNIKEGQVLRWNKPKLDSKGEPQRDAQNKVIMEAAPTLIHMDDDVAIAAFVAESDPSQIERLKKSGMLWEEQETPAVLRRKANAEAKALKKQQKDEGVVLDLVGGQDTTPEVTPETTPDTTDADNA